MIKMYPDCDPITSKKCPEFIKNYLECRLVNGKVPTFTDKDGKVTDKYCWNGKYYTF